MSRMPLQMRVENEKEGREGGLCLGGSCVRTNNNIFVYYSNYAVQISSIQRDEGSVLWTLILRILCIFAGRKAGVSGWSWMD